MKVKLLVIGLFLLQTAFSINVFSQISQAEKENIRLVREEEKVAQNFYTKMNEKYDLRVFKNISESESMHMQHAKDLLDKFGISDPVSGSHEAAGMFLSTKLSNLYDNMMREGNKSVIDALSVSAKFEEMDIKELKEYCSETSDVNVKSTYQALINASENHLRAFVRNLKVRGTDYLPVYLSKAEFDNIISEKH
jgi:hypothetical protein